MAKQLGDQGGLSKNLQKREGEGYGETRDGAGVAYSGSAAKDPAAGWSNLPRLPLVFPSQSDTVQHLVGGGGGAPLAGGKASETARPGRSLTGATDVAQVTHTSGGEVLGAQRTLG